MILAGLSLAASLLASSAGLLVVQSQTKVHDTAIPRRRDRGAGTRIGTSKTPMMTAITPRAFGSATDVAGHGDADEGAAAAMIETFEATSGTLGDRLIAALRAAIDAGGEAGNPSSLLSQPRLAFDHARRRRPRRPLDLAADNGTSLCCDRNI
jgi:hypothetical protein